ncbi:MAG TPA: amidohydrolase [Anaerolineales bacterium]|nr:amidohydrolase [Anaerolineae bacterium]HIQ01888.1 amidohydrolase [Anaerolineales bacterium]
MERADLILTGGVVATMNERFDLFEPGAVAVRGRAIVAVGLAEQVSAAWEAEEVVDCGGQVVMPGLVNAHTHAPMTLVRGLADDLRLDVWLMGYMMPVERAFVRPDFCWLGTQLACAEMIRSGVTCFGDMYYYEEAVADAAAQVGMRGVCAQSILKFPTPDAMSYDEGLRLAQDFVGRWKGHHLILPAIGPHAAYTATVDMLRECARLALEYDVPIHIHLAETGQEVQDHRAEFGMPVVPWVKKQGVFEARVTAMHCVHLDDGELHTLLHHGVGVAHNPSSNLKLASGIAPVARMLELGLPVGIGTDGPASNNDLDMFEEMRLAALLAKGASANPTAVPARQAVAMATRLGAQALHLGHMTGSLEVGKRADIAVVNLEDIHLTPRFHRDPDGIYSMLVYAAKSGDVCHVLCDGRWLMRDRVLLTVDVEALRAQAAAVARKIDHFLMAREESVLSKLLAIGGVAREKTFEVQVKVHLPDASAVEGALAGGELPVVKSSRRRQYDTYFLFDDPEHSRLRYREDEVLDEQGEPIDVRYRLTLTGPTKEREFAHSVLLSRSRFDAPATRSLRFYREYFKPSEEWEVHKERRRYHIRYGGTDFAVNMDRVSKPDLPGVFLEVKSRTWSAQDAERKAELIGELLALFGVREQELVRREYLELAREAARLRR